MVISQIHLDMRMYGYLNWIPRVRFSGRKILEALIRIMGILSSRPQIADILLRLVQLPMMVMYRVIIIIGVVIHQMHGYLKLTKPEIYSGKSVTVGQKMIMLMIYN